MAGCPLSDFHEVFRHSDIHIWCIACLLLNEWRYFLVLFNGRAGIFEVVVVTIMYVSGINAEGGSWWQDGIGLADWSGL